MHDGTWTLVRASFRALRIAHPAWTLEDLFRSIEIDPTSNVRTIAFELGFIPAESLRTEDIARVLDLSLSGHTAAEVRRQTGFSVEQVGRILAERGGYGVSAYGVAPYGANRAYSDGQEAVPRRVSPVGQLSYRGETYTLGIVNAGCRASILETDGVLLVTLTNGRRIRLPRRLLPLRLGTRPGGGDRCPG